MTSIDYGCFVSPDTDGRLNLYLQVQGLRCAACAHKIEMTLNAHDGVEARVNYSTERLKISWPQMHAAKLANQLAQEIETLGYQVAPYDQARAGEKKKSYESFLLRCLAVAGFGMGNVMLFSQAIWFSPDGAVTGATRDVMHWLMALIALPTVIYAGRPFFYSALEALKAGRTNMDVPISLAVILASGLSVYETKIHGEFVYFDASVMLLFFLLIGRYLDSKARGKAREAAEGLLAMLDGTAKVILGNGSVQSKRIRDLQAEEVLLITAGEKIAADGVVIDGQSDIDTHMVTGETLPRSAAIGTRLYAGMINLSAPLRLKISAAGDQSLLSEVVSLMEKAEQGQAQYVRLADRVASLYAPVVHVLALLTLIGWLIVGPKIITGFHWENALLNAMAVLIITCPCALGLAVPVVQVMASSQLFKNGILLKSGKGLETLAAIDAVVFDKTGTLTKGAPQWLNSADFSPEEQSILAAMTAQSAHPLSQAVAQSLPSSDQKFSLTDKAGFGLEATIDRGQIQLGKGAWVGAENTDDQKLEMWLKIADSGPKRLIFEDALRDDAGIIIAQLKSAGLKAMMLSGDRTSVAQTVAQTLGLDDFKAELTPVEKVAALEALKADGRKVLMVGDGLNDAAALRTAFVSMSPSSGVDITQNAAEIVYRGEMLSPVYLTYQIARRTQALVKQNIGLSIVYNVLAIPLAVMGLVTPLLAALAMSGSSLIVIANAFRLKMQRL